MLFCFQAEDGIRDLVRSRGLGDVYKRQDGIQAEYKRMESRFRNKKFRKFVNLTQMMVFSNNCLLYTSDAADERSSVDLGGRRIIKKKKKGTISHCR